MLKTLGKIGLIAALTFAGADSGAAELIKNVRVKENNDKYYFVMFQSEVEPSLWYCGQIKPQILMRQAGKTELPEISLIKFQKKDIKNPEKLNEGAHLRLHLSLGPSDFALTALEKKAKSKARGKPVRLSPVPFSALKLCLQTPKGEEVELQAEPLSGISQKHSSQNVAFSVTLGKLETDLIDSLLRGNTGAKYLLYYNYSFADPVLTGQQTPATIEQRQIGSDSPNRTGSNRRLPGSRNFDAITREAAAKTSWDLAGEGFIGFAQYTKEVQDQCIFIETNPDAWEKAYLSLPLIQQPENLSIDRIDLAVTPILAGKKGITMPLSWTQAKGWRDRFGAPLVYAVFELDEFKSERKKNEEAIYQISQTIISNKTDSLQQEYKVPMIVGDAPISNPLNLADVFELQTSFLSWSENQKNGLQSIEIKISEGEWQARRTFRPKLKNGQIVGDDVQQWLIKTEEKDSKSFLQAELFFIVSENGETKRIPWKLNGKDLRRELPSMSYIFFDQDWEN